MRPEIKTDSWQYQKLGAVLFPNSQCVFFNIPMCCAGWLWDSPMISRTRLRGLESLTNSIHKKTDVKVYNLCIKWLQRSGLCWYTESIFCHLHTFSSGWLGWKRIETWKNWRRFPSLDMIYSKNPTTFKVDSFSWQKSFDIVFVACNKCSCFWINYQFLFFNSQLWPKKTAKLL